MINHRNNLVRIKAVHNALGDLRDEVVFVGGATVSLYVDRMAEEVRPTEDIDIVVELWAHNDYAALDERLRKMGFVNDQDSGVICRYIVQGIIVDVMATGENALMFTNRWYADGFKNTMNYQIDENSIKIFTPPYFIASKIEAFKGRGHNDGRTSTDFEDIIYVLENRGAIWDELKSANEDVRTYLQDEFRNLLTVEHFEEWVDVHAGFGSPPASYYIIDRLSEFSLEK